MDDSGAPTGTTGAIAVTADVAAVMAVGTGLATHPDVRAVAVHTDGDDWALLRATGDAAAIVDACRSIPGASTAEILSRRLRRHRVTWRADHASPGVSMVFDVRRRNGMAVEAFHRHWRDTHGPLALGHHLGMWDYDQLSVVPGSEIDLDGVAVVGFPSAEDARTRFFDTDEGAEIIRADAASFTDPDTLGRRLTTEWVLRDDADAASVDGAAQDWADHRSLHIDASPDDVWTVLGDFGGLLDWWPGGLDTIAVTPGPPVARTLGRADGTTVVESLVHHRPAERMFQLRVDAGFPASVVDYTCRYEVRPTGAGCRLDWMPRARVAVGRESDFAAIVDGGWQRISEGLQARFPG